MCHSFKWLTTLNFNLFFLSFPFFFFFFFIIFLSIADNWGASSSSSGSLPLWSLIWWAGPAAGNSGSGKTAAFSWAPQKIVCSLENVLFRNLPLHFYFSDCMFVYLLSPAMFLFYHKLLEVRTVQNGRASN